MQKSHSEFIIVGLGIGGISLAYQLMLRGISFIVVNKSTEHSSSRVASGLVNPITGRNYVKSWMIDQLLPYAQRFYQDLFKLLGVDIINDKRILRSLKNAEEENKWLSRSGDPKYQQYIHPSTADINYKPYLNNFFSLGLVNESFSVKSDILIDRFTDLLKSRHAYMEEDFVHSDLSINGIFQYKNISADHIIFAEGYNVVNNLYFNYLPFAHAKGEVLICRIPEMPDDYIIKFHKFFVPIAKEFFWVGSTYEWQFDDHKPTKAKRDELENFLKEFLKVPYVIEDHLAGVRPATKYRRPFVGAHPDINKMYIFNGLGTKGFSLAPFWSQYLIDYILNPSSIHPELPKIHKV